MSVKDAARESGVPRAMWYGREYLLQLNEFKELRLDEALLLHFEKKNGNANLPIGGHSFRE